MLDRNLFIKDFDATSENLKRKIGNNDEVATYLSELRSLIKIRRDTQSTLEKLRAEMNVRSKEFGLKVKTLSLEEKAKEQNDLVSLKTRIQNLEESLSPLQEKEEEILLQVEELCETEENEFKNEINPIKLADLGWCEDYKLIKIYNL